VVWPLIVESQRHRRSPFSPELVAAIFWEESAFRLVRNRQSNAAGFGQVVPSTLKAVNRRFGTKFVPADLVTSPAASVEASILALELAWEWKRDKLAALRVYAGGPTQDHVIRKWLAAETAMRRGREAGPVPRDITGPELLHVLRGLRLCSQPGFDPLMAVDGSL